MTLYNGGWTLLTTFLTAAILPDLLEANVLRNLVPHKGKADEAVILPAHKASDFLGEDKRMKRHTKWYHKNPDFQAWYKYYQSIGHTEGLNEIDRIRFIYMQMRHLETVYGANAPYYQHTLGVPPPPKKVALACDPKKDRGCKAQPQVQAPVAAPKAPSAPQAACNPRDTACLLQFYYQLLTAVQSGAHCDPHTDPKCLPAKAPACDPKYNPYCNPSSNSNPNPGHALSLYQQAEEACDPMDPACRGQHDSGHRGYPQRPARPEEEERGEEEEEEEEDEEMDPYDPRRYYQNPGPYGAGRGPEYDPYGQYGGGSPYNPYSPPSSAHRDPNSSPYGPHNPSPYDPSNGYPYGYPYNSPNNNPYGQQPNSSPYGSPYGSQPGVGYPYGSPYPGGYGAPYDPYAREDEEDEEEY